MESFREGTAAYPNPSEEVRIKAIMAASSDGSEDRWLWRSCSKWSESSSRFSNACWGSHRWVMRPSDRSATDCVVMP